VKYEICSELRNPTGDSINQVLFFGDYKEKIIMSYNLNLNVWSKVEASQADESFELLDYSSVSTFPNGDMLLTGGCQYTNYNNSAQKTAYLIKFVSNMVRILPFRSLITDRFSHGSLIIKNIPYVFGGHDGNETLSSLEFYDDHENKWKFLSFMNIEREIFAYCAVKQRFIYVFGGFNVNHLDSIERYDTIYDRWKLMNFKMKRPLQNSTAVEIDNSRIVLIGGYNGALHKCVDILDLETKTWTSLEFMKVPRRKSHCFLYRNKIHIFGGESSESESHVPEFYDFKTKTWGWLTSYDEIVNRSLNFWCSTSLYI